MADSWLQPAFNFTTGGTAEDVEPMDGWFEYVDDPENTGDGYIYPVMSEILQAVDNGIIFVSSMTLLVFACIGVGWFVIYNIDAVSQEIVTRDFADAFGSIVFIIGLITNTLIIEAKAKSTARPRMYDALLDAIGRMTRKMTGVRLAILHEGTDREWRRGRPATAIAPETSAEVNQHMHNIAMYLFVMTRYSYIVFQPNDPHRDYLEFVTSDEYAKYENILMQTIGARFKHETVTNIFTNAILLIETQITHMHHNGVVPSGTYTNLVTVLDDISEKVHNINVSMRIATPRIFDQTSYAVLFFYLIVLLPLQVYSNVRGWMMMVYPLALFIYVSNILFGAWMGDPLMSHPRFAGAEVIAWRHQLYAYIRELLLRDVQLNAFSNTLHKLEEDPAFLHRLGQMQSPPE